MTEAPAPAVDRKKGRSPSYPGVALDFAISRAQMLYDNEQLNWAPVSAVYAHWNYAPKSGPATVTLSALIKYGLLEEEGAKGDRKVKMSDLAMEILLSPDPAPAIRRAALLPPIHQDMYDRFLKDGGTLPTDATLKYELHKMGFTATGASDFIGQFRKTMAFADLTATGSVPSDQQNAGEQDDDDDQSGDDRSEQIDTRRERKRRDRKERTVSDTMEITIPLKGMDPVEMTIPQPLTGKAWDQMLKVLSAMKDGIVDDEPDA